jgi:hypothetical protein
MIIQAVLLLLFFVLGYVAGWKLTANRERMKGYSQALDEQYQRLVARYDSISKLKSKRTNFKIIKGGKE